MNEDLRQLEAELARLIPRTPSGALGARIESAIDPASGSDRPCRPPAASSRPVFRWERWRPALSIAAGLLLAVGVYFFGPFQEDPLSGPRDQKLSPAAELSGLDSPEVEAAGDEAVRFRPIRAENALRNRFDEGLVLLDNGLAARRIRLQFVDTVTWQNPRDGAEFEIATPREEIVFVPVHTF